MIELSNKFIGNQRLLNKLYNGFVNNSLTNSIIFSGPKGIGKNTLAFFLIDKVYKNIKSIYNNNNNLVYKNHHPNFRYIRKELNEKNNKIKNNITINQLEV